MSTQIAIVLLIVGAALLAAEAHVPTHGVLGAAAAAALTAAVVLALSGAGAPVAEGSAVVVESIDGLTLTVRPAEEWEVR